MLWGAPSTIRGLAIAARSAAAAQLGVSVTVVNGIAMAVAGTVLTATAIVTGTAGVILGNAPPAIRDLPGVRQIARVEPPSYDFSILGLHSPLSVAVTRDGSTLYVVDGTGDRSVRKIRLSDRSFEPDLVPPLTVPGTRKPLSVAVRPDGVVYVADRARRAVDMFDANGQWFGVLTPPGNESDWSPLSVDIDETGVAYVSNSSEAGPVLAIYGPDGKLTGSRQSIVVNGLPVSFVNGVAVAPDGSLAISDSNNSRIVLLDPKSGNAVKLGGNPSNDLALPRGIALESHRLGLVADASDHTLSAWDLSTKGERIFQIGAPGIGNGEFLFPNDVAMSRDGRIFIADRDNDRIQVWR